MTFLVTNPDNKTDGGTLELDGADSIASADVGGFTYVFVAGGVDDGVSVFRLLANGTLTPVFDVTDNATLKLDGATGLSTAMVDGNTYLFVAGVQDSGVSVFRVGTDGSLTNTGNVTDDGTMFLSGVTDTATARVGTSTYLFTAGTADDGISVFRVAGNGTLTNIGNTADSALLRLDGVDALTTVTVGGTAFLIAAGGVDDGVSVFSISAAGVLTNQSQFVDNGTVNLNGASDITSAVIGGVTYVFVAGAADNGISVFTLNSSGVLTNVFNFTDTVDTLVAGATSLSISTIGTSTYLLVGGTENGLSMFRVETGSNSNYAAGSLTFVDNIADQGSRELSGTVSTASASIGGTNYFLGAGATDDGVSTFRSTATGQLYFFGQGGGADARLAYVNNDGGNQTSLVDDSPTTDLVTTFPEELGVDTAAGFYFALDNGGNDGSGSRLVRGSLSGGLVTTLVTYDGVNNVVGDLDDEIVNALHVDVINHKVYLGIQDPEGDGPGATGIFVYDYSPTTGAISNGHFLTTVTSSGKPQESGFDILDVRDFDVDPNTHLLFFTELLTGGVSANGLFRLDINNPNVILQLVPQAQFPDNGSNGYITDVEVDNTTGIVYFDVESQHAFPNAGYVAGQNNIYWISETANGSTNATLLTLNGLPGGGHFYPGDMVFDQGTRQLYVESEETDDGSGADTDDVVYVFQLSLDGHSATLINTISLVPPVTNIAANIGGMIFNDIPLLASVTGTATHIGEQGAAVQLLTGAPTITDADGDHLSSATVQVTQGLFSSNDSNASDDRLFFGTTLAASGTVAGTNISWAYNSATNTLTFTGYDTLANYQTAFAGVRFQSLGDNPTNFGLDTTRTITWTVSDGAVGVPGGSQNSATTSITIDAVNDAPVNNNVPASVSTPEDTPKAITGLSISDPDANPAITNVTVTLSVTNGTLTLLTNVANGLVAGQITGNGTNSVTITAPLNDINATLGSATGLTYTNIADYNGSDTLHIVTNDGGNTGSGGAKTDTDDIAITVTAVQDIANDTVTVAEDSGANNLNSGGNNILTNDTFENLGRTITSVGTASHGTVTINDNGNGAGSDDFVVYTPTGNYNGSDSFTYTVTSGGVTETATVTVNVTAVNDPVTNTTPNSGTVNEDVSAAITNMSIADVDATLAPAGIYEVTLSALHGTLTLSTLTGLTFTGGSDGTADATMTFHGTLANINNALATASYLSNLNYNGSETITFAVTDTFNGTVATGTGAATNDSHSYIFTVNAVNDPPVNTVPGTQTINEDATKTFTTISVADVDAGTLTVTLTVAHGTLTLSGTTGLSFGPGDGSADTTMTFTGTTTDINNALTGLLYTPNGDFNGVDTLSIVTNDNGLTGSGGALQDSDNVTINITAINDAPTVVNGATVSVPATNEDTAGAGATIDSLLATHYSDAADNQIPNGGASSPGAFTGVAITANGSSAGTGQWQYLSGVTWINIGTVSDAAAKLFDHNTQIRFNPAPDYNGPAPTLTVHLVDNSLGFGITDAQVVNISAPGATGGTTAYSAGTVVIDTSVTSVNDAPTQTGIGGDAATWTENAGSPAFLDVGQNALISDIDSTNFDGGTLTILISGGVVAEDGFGIANTGTISASGSTVSYNGTQFATYTGGGVGGGNIVFTFDANATPAAVTALVQALVFVNDDGSGEYPTAGLRNITWTLVDGDGMANSGHDTLIFGSTVNVVALNDTPAVSLNNSNSSTEQVAAALDLGASVHDNDLDARNGLNGDYSGSTLTIANNGGNNANDLFGLVSSGGFTVSGANLQAGGLTFATFTGGNGTPLVITFTSSGTPATTSLVNDVIKAVQYTYTGDTPPASIDVIVSMNDGAPGNANQGSVASNPAVGSDIIHINITDTPEDAAPVIDLNGAGVGIDNTANYTENDGPVILAGGLLVTDADDTNIEGATVSVGAGFVPNFDYLSVNGGTVGSIGAISWTYSAASGILTLTGSDTLANYQAVLAQVGFESTSDNPGASRTITWTVTDGDLPSADAHTVIAVTSQDDAPTGLPDAFTTDEATAITTGNVFANNGSGADNDVDGPALTVSEVNGSGANVGVPITLLSGAHLTLNANGTFSYDPNHAFDDLPAAGSGASNLTDTDSFTYTLAGGSGPVMVTVTLSGLDSDDTLLGTPGSDTLIGGIGVDTMSAGAGDDNYYVDNFGDVVNELPGEGRDVVYAGVSYALGTGSSVEVLATDNLTATTAFNLAGNDLDNVITGNAGANILIGGGGEDALYGLGGDDTYYVDGLDDSEFELPGGGTDVVYTSGSHALAAGSAIEFLSAADLSATTAFNLAGNELDNVIIGNAGTNILIGGGGADYLAGGGGNDTYYVDSVDDRAVETAGGGSDVVYASSSYALAAGSEVEYLSAVDLSATTALNLAGNELNNIIYGNAGSNLLIGGGGTDFMAGGAGDDIYYVDSSDDRVSEELGQGSDVVYTSASFTLEADSEVETLAAVDPSAATPLNLTGNALGNGLYGNAGANVLNGGGGADYLFGGGGADTFQFTSALGGGNIATIGDFVSGTDKLVLDDAVFSGLALGSVPATVFHVGASATAEDQRIIYDQATGNLYYDADGNGAGAQVLFATLSDHPTLTAGDFQVI